MICSDGRDRAGFLRRAAAACLSCLAFGAMAQDDAGQADDLHAPANLAPSAEQPVDRPADATPAEAATAAANDAPAPAAQGIQILEELVVTAEKRETSLKLVPISVQAFSPPAAIAPAARK